MEKIYEMLKKELIIKEYGKVCQWDTLEIKSVSARIARAVCDGG